MGCASSGPVGKNLVDGAQDALGNVEHMGENALHDLGNAAKGGMEHVKESMDSALHTAEDGIGSAIHKIEEAIGIKKDESDHLAEEMKEAVEGFEEASEDAARDAADSTNKMVDGVIEEVSEAETVPASEEDIAPETLLVATEIPMESTPPPPLEDGLKVEDMEADDGMGSTVAVDESQTVVEELVTTPTSASPPPEEAKEELTPWEKAADAILNRPTIQDPDPNDLDKADKEFTEAVEQEVDRELLELEKLDAEFEEVEEEKVPPPMNHLEVVEIRSESLVA